MMEDPLHKVQFEEETDNELVEEQKRNEREEKLRKDLEKRSKAKHEHYDSTILSSEDFLGIAQMIRK